MQKDNFIKNEDIGKICLCCLKRTNNLHKIKIEPLDYGSYFDGWGTELDLCDDCYNSAPEALKNLKIESDEEFLKLGYDCKKYFGENEIFDFLESLNLLGLEVVFNRNKTDILFPTPKIDPEVWIKAQKELDKRKKV